MNQSLTTDQPHRLTTDIEVDQRGEHHSEHDPRLQGHFATFEQQFDAAKIGMWLFLATEILMFGGLFVGFALQQAAHPQAFVEAHHHLDKRLGALNTVVLLLSSFTMVMAVWSAQNARRKAMTNYLIVTFLCAATFMVVKFFEYEHKFHDGTLPGSFYRIQHVGETPNQFIFFSFYFMMTGLHGIHVLVGMALILWLIIKGRDGRFDGTYYTPVDLIGLYWHLVDMIWIYLFPLLYLIT